MADATTVVEGKIKYREGKKWKLRWCVLKKPSPVADRLQLMLYKDVHQALRAGGRIKTSFPLEGYFGLESGFTFDKENNVLAIICQKQITLLAFETRDYLIQFEIKVRQSLGQDDRFPVQLIKVPVGSRLPLESVNLLIHGVQFCLTAQVPPRILHSWNVSDLRRFGAVEGKFCFEGGSRCGKGAGVHALQTDQAEVIAEILQRNSLGKSAPCLRTANNRSSQILDYSLAASDPTRSYAETQPFAVCSSGFIPGPSPERLGMLGCCQAVAGNEPDEWGCRKRHSVSVTDFHRAGAATFQEKLRLMSIENLERQRLMAIYDVPPKHPRKLEMPAPSASGVMAEKETCAVSVELESQAFHHQKQTSHLTVKLEATKEVTEAHLDELRPSSRAVTSLASSAGREYCVPRSLNSTLFDSIVNAQVDTTKRHEALQRLVKQESHLHQEIILLDQMLQGCHPDDEADKKENSGGSPNISGNEIGTYKIASPILSSTPISVHQKASSLPPKNKNMEFNTANILQPITSASDNCMMYLREKDAKDTFCPDFLSKLEKIPCHSHLNTPLPYVNLAKYDEGMDGSHIHIPGNAEWNTAAISALKSTLHRNPVGGSLASLGVGQSKNGQMCGLPARCHSETHIVSIASDAQVDLSVHQESLSSSNPQDSSRMSINLKCISSTNMFLEDDSILPPTTFAPPVPYPRTLIASGTLGDMPTRDVPPSTYAPPIPSTPQVLTLSSAIREPIYANEPPPPPPPRKISDTPPPDLPPKGPALIRKSKHRNANNNSTSNEGVPPPPPVRTRSLSVGSQGKFYGYDNQPAATTVLPENSSKSEDNYLPMGSPKVKPRSREQKTTESFQKEEDSRPISAIFSSSTKSHGSGMPASVRRGNADVLSGYMDMANMFIEEPKQNDYLENSDISRHGSVNSRELNMSEPILNSKQADASAVDSNYLYMEMSSLPPPPKRKSAVLKNLEALQTYLSTTGGDSFHKPSAAYGHNGRHRENIRDPLRPAIPFVNLKNFEQKQIKSYVNTYIPTRDIPLPEPPKKEEGFFARLIRRNSKDKVTTQSQENLNAPKNRASVFERSLSEQGEEKVNSKLKVGRRRSASFPNRLSFQETATSTGTQPTSKKDTPPPPPPPRTSMPATYVAVQQTLASSQDSHSGNDEQKKQTADATSLHDLSDDSDLAPLLKNEGNKNDTRVLTVLHVQQDFSAQKIHMYTDMTSDKCNGDSIYYKLSDSTYSVSDSSKTDDEKLIELLTSSKRQSFASEISSIKSKMSLPLVPAGKRSPSEEAAAIARHVASVPPFIPPKTKKLQLSPVKELASPITLPPSLQPVLAPPQHPHLPSAPNQDEAIYVDMKELLPQHGPASPTIASHHPYNCPREQKQRARATLRITPAVEDEEGNIWVPRKDIVSGEAPTPLSLIDPPPHLPGLSPRLPPNFVSRFSPRPGETPSSLSELHYSTPLVVSVDPLEGAGEGMAERLSLSSRGSSSCQSQCSIEPGVRTSPAATVLRPRSGRDYQVVERRCLGSSSLSSSPAARSPTCSTIFTYDVCSADPKSPGSSSMSSWHSRERESSPFKHCHWQHSPALPFASSRDQTPPPKSGDFTRSVRDTGSPPKIFRTDRRAKSEPCTGGPESPVAISHSVKSSPPNSPQVPNLPVFAPEQLEPMLNYAEIDLTMPSSPPPVETFSKRQKKVPPKATVIEYTQIDHTATNALKRAGLEHAQAREDSLRRAITPNISFSKFSYKDRKGSSNSSRERKLSTSSSDSI